MGISHPKLRQEFDKIIVSEGVQCLPPQHSINLLIDATYFGRKYGFFVFHDKQRVIYFTEIKSETVADLRQALHAVMDAGFRVKSVTIDGRRGFYEAIKKICGNPPVQMCLFHQKMIIRRYISDKPKSACGKELKKLVDKLCFMEAQIFIDEFFELKNRHKNYLNQRNEKGDFAHQSLRSAMRSLETNLTKLFSYQEWPKLQIPATTNRLEGMFGHLKEKINIHRGLCPSRKKNAIKFLLKNS